MEDIENTQSENPISDLTISNQSKTFLKETAKWSKFLAIVGFVFVGIMVLFTFFFNQMINLISNGMSSFSNGFGFFPFIYLIGAIIYYIPTKYLWNYSKKLTSALENNDSEILTEAFLNQKSLYKFIGIFTLIFIVIYLLMGLGALMFSSLMQS